MDMLYDEFVFYCKIIAQELNTRVECDNTHNEYGWARVSFQTDPFGGDYLMLNHYKDTGKVVANFGGEDEQEITSISMLTDLVQKNRDEELAGRNLEKIYEQVNEQYD